MPSAGYPQPYPQPLKEMGALVMKGRADGTTQHPLYVHWTLPTCRILAWCLAVSTPSFDLQSKMAARSVGGKGRDREPLIFSLLSFGRDKGCPCKTLKKGDQVFPKART